ncbi:MAG: OmpA family protein [Oscillatoria princeps RMCB-10]|jgi:outer membrane protein OmpA-like peptidoglycan-associated protein|nr:OmpA family protein [Oscillatoria princeps RMCB-10]
MKKLMRWRDVTVASFFLLAASACQGAGKQYPEVTTLESQPVPVTTLMAAEPVGTTTLEVVGAAGNTTTTLEPKSQGAPATELKSEGQPATKTEVETQPVAPTAVESSAPPATPAPAPVPVEPPPATPAPATVPVEPSKVEVEKIVTELKAERTVEGIKFNLPENILFEFDQYSVRAKAKPTLAKINQLLSYYKDAQVFIYGHTDSKGDDDYNIDLSKKRAAAVKYYLVNVFKQPAPRMQTKGFGESKPLDRNENPDGSDNEAGREKNRRVEFIIKTETRKEVISPGADTFGLAVKSAQDASLLVQSAKTPEDWNKVAKKWQEAIQLMKEVPASSPNYQNAQKKVGEYEKNLKYAQQNAGI